MTPIPSATRYRVSRHYDKVTQPRRHCYRVGIRMSEPRMPALLTSSGRPGFYFRVLEEGEVGAGDGASEGGADGSACRSRRSGAAAL